MICDWQGSQAVTMRHVRPYGTQKDADRIDVDGLPYVGAVVYPKQSYYSKVDTITRGARLPRPTLSCMASTCLAACRA